MAALSPQAASLADTIAPALAPAPLPAPAAAGAAVAPPQAGPAPVPADTLAGAAAPPFPSIDPQMIQLLMSEILAAQAGDQEQLASAQQEALFTNPIFLQLLGLLPQAGAGLDGQAIGGVQQVPSEKLVLGG